MREKGHAGNLEFIHGKDADGEDRNEAEGEIIVKVIPDAMQAGKGAMQVQEHGLEASALSGGEKSLTSLILLSAIATASGPPFRIIDEFDVFQDEQTRRKSIEYLLEDARRAGEDGKLTQFVLLTPHDLTSRSESSDNIKVFHMPKPKRHRGEE